MRVELAAWAQNEAVGLTDGRVLLDRLIEWMRAGRIIIPGISVVERLAAAAMHSADLAAIAEVYRAALASMTDAIHAEPLSVWFGEGWRASADGQAFYLGGPGEAGGAINGHYGRDPIVKIYTTITDRYAPLHQKVIAGTAGKPSMH